MTELKTAEGVTIPDGKCEDCGEPMCERCICDGRQYPAAVCF